MAESTFFDRLKKSHLFKVASLYLVSSWLVIQIVTSIFPVFELPIWTQQAVIVMATIGFPITLLVAWMQQRKLANTNQQSSSFSWLIIMGIGVISVIGSLIWLLSSKGSQSVDLLPEQIRKERVAIAVLENRTGKSELNALGFLAAEWTTKGLRELDIDMVAPEIVREYQDRIGITLSNKEKKASFQELTGAGFVVSGSYFELDDSIRIISRLMNTSNGEQIQDFSEITGTINDKEELVKKFRSTIMGYWVTRKNITQSNINPPKYEAYQAYMKAIEIALPGDRDWHLKAIELDSNFIIPYLSLLSISIWWGNEDAFQMHLASLQNKLHLLTQYEKRKMEYLTLFHDQEYELAIEVLEAMYAEDPNDIFIIHDLAWMSNALLNNPQRTIEVYNTYFENRSLNDVPILSNVLDHWADAYIRLNKFEVALELLQSANYERVCCNNFHRNYINANGKLQQWDNILNLLNENGKYPQADEWAKSQNALVAYNWYEYYHKNNSTKNPYEEILQSNYPENIEFLFAKGAYIKADSLLTVWMSEYDKKILSGNYNDFDGKANWWEWESTLMLKSSVGRIAAYQNQKEESLQAILSIEKDYQELKDKIHQPNKKGNHRYEQAKIYAILGEKEKAVMALKTSLTDGKLMIWDAFTFDVTLLKYLEGYPPFDELIQPKTNAIKN